MQESLIVSPEFRRTLARGRQSHPGCHGSQGSLEGGEVKPGNPLGLSSNRPRKPKRGALLSQRIAVVLLASATVCAADEPFAGNAADSLLFTSFRGNGEDGLHLAWSQDGYTWTPLKDNQPLLRPKSAAV